MRKIAIFLEGHTELIIVREYLLRYFNYSDVEIECRTLFRNNDLKRAEYDYPSPNASNHFQLINVGNDNAVLSRILKREQYMWNAGYDKIIGLRDMYCRTYKEDSTKIDSTINIRMITLTNEEIMKRAIKPKAISFCFAIMEVEAWMLGIKDIFIEINTLLTSQYINDNLGFNLEEIDPENEFFHPASIISQIYKLVGLNYDKKKGDIEAIANSCTIEKYKALFDSEKCNSFNLFVNEIL